MDERPKVKKRVWKPFRGLEIEVTEKEIDQTEVSPVEGDVLVVHPRRALLFLPLLAFVLLRFWPGAENRSWFWLVAGLAAACLVFYWVLRRRDRERAAMPGEMS